jgi:hypothetical protein
MFPRAIIVAVSFLLVACTGTRPVEEEPDDSGIADGGSDGGDSGWGSPAQHAYTYPGCDAATYHCPNNLTYYCALRTIQEKYRDCAVDQDCARAELLGDCQDFGGCSSDGVVAAAELGAFEAEAAVEVNRYCGGDAGGCYLSGLCAFEYLPRCVGGRCTALPADGGA